MCERAIQFSLFRGGEKEKSLAISCNYAISCAFIVTKHFP